MGRRVEKVWETKDGRKINIEDMGDRHLINSYKMVKRSGAIDPSTLDFYLYTDGPTGEMASYFFEQEVDVILTAPVTPFVGWFEEEMAKRSIEIPEVEEEGWY